jgi:hypothetical protein
MVKFIKYCYLCESYVARNGRWKKLRWWNWYKKLYFNSVEKGYVKNLIIYATICPNCRP